MTTPRPAAADSGPLGPWIERVLEVGGGVVPALRALGRELPRRRQPAWGELCETLATGDEARASRALDRDPDTWIPLLAAAAPGATTGDGVAEGAFLERAVDVAVRDEVDARWWLPAVYPLFVLLLVLGIACLLSVVVVSQFETVFGDFGLRLPGITRALIWFARALRAGWWLLLLGFVLAVVVWFSLERWWPASIRLPVSWFVRSGRFARHAAELLCAGVPQEAAVAVASRAVDPYGASGGEMPRWLSRTVRHALAADVATATRIRLLERIAAGHDARLAARRSWASWCLGPVAVFITGLFVFLLVLALFMPMITLVSALSS